MIKKRPPLSANKPLSERHAYKADGSLRHGPAAKKTADIQLWAAKKTSRKTREEEEEGASLLLPTIIFLFTSLRNDSTISKWGKSAAAPSSLNWSQSPVISTGWSLGLDYLLQTLFKLVPRRLCVTDWNGRLSAPLINPWFLGSVGSGLDRCIVCFG